MERTRNVLLGVLYSHERTPPSSHRLFDLPNLLGKLMHFLPQLSDFVTLKNGFYSFRAQTD